MSKAALKSRPTVFHIALFPQFRGAQTTKKHCSEQLCRMVLPKASHNNRSCSGDSNQNHQRYRWSDNLISRLSCPSTEALYIAAKVNAICRPLKQMIRSAQNTVNFNASDITFYSAKVTNVSAKTCVDVTQCDNNIVT